MLAAMMVLAMAAGNLTDRDLGPNERKAYQIEMGKIPKTAVADAVGGEVDRKIKEINDKSDAAIAKNHEEGESAISRIRGRDAGRQAEARRNSEAAKRRGIEASRTKELAPYKRLASLIDNLSKAEQFLAQAEVHARFGQQKKASALANQGIKLLATGTEPAPSIMNSDLPRRTGTAQADATDSWFAHWEAIARADGGLGQQLLADADPSWRVIWGRARSANSGDQTRMRTAVINAMSRAWAGQNGAVARYWETEKKGNATRPAAAGRR